MCTQGTLEVNDGDGNCLGYVRNTCNSNGQYGLTSNDDERLIVCIDLPTASGGGCDIHTEVCPTVCFF